MKPRQAFTVRWLVRLYGLALLLYPKGSRREYAQEMQAVFSLKAQDAAQQGAFPFLHFACREACSLPRAILSSYLDERKVIMKRLISDLNPDAPLNTWKVTAVFLPFLIALLYSVANRMNGTIAAILGITMLVLLIATWITGLATGLPVWTLPSLGMLFFFFYILILRGTAQAFIYGTVMLRLYGGWPHELSLGIQMMLLVSLGTILTVAITWLGLLGLIPHFRERIQKDWTLLSFLLYGMAIMPLFMDDPFTHLLNYQFTCLLLLALGAALYLKMPRHWQRILALIIPVVLSQAIFALGLYQTYPLESWINLADPTQRIWEALQPFSDPLLFLLLLPALAPFVPWWRRTDSVTG
jgi:hypothetical protein